MIVKSCEHIQFFSRINKLYKCIKFYKDNLWGHIGFNFLQEHIQYKLICLIFNVAILHENFQCHGKRPYDSFSIKV